jgi:hypothetical protein
MAKIVNGSLVLDPNDRIEFVDIHGLSHVVYWDDILDRFIADGQLEADQFVGATNAVSVPRNPQPSDSLYVVPTIWINTSTTASFILVGISSGEAVWRNLNFEGSGSQLDHRITINDGILPAENDPFDMWIMIDPV